MSFFLSHYGKLMSHHRYRTYSIGKCPTDSIDVTHLLFMIWKRFVIVKITTPRILFGTETACISCIGGTRPLSACLPVDLRGIALEIRDIWRLYGWSPFYSSKDGFPLN